MSPSIFYLGYIVGSYPSALLAQRFPISRFLFALIIVWEFVLWQRPESQTGKDCTYTDFFFLGALESGVTPAFMMVVGRWYKRSEQSLRMG